MTEMSLLEAIGTQPLSIIKRRVANKSISVDLLNCDPLSQAIALGKKDAALYLLSINMIVNKKSTKPYITPLHNAIRYLADLELVKELLNRYASVVAVDHEGNTPLHLAFILGQEKVKDLLLDYVVETARFENVKNKFGLSHFLVACTSKNDTYIQWYIKNKSYPTDTINVDSPYYSGFSAMQLAIVFRSLGVIKVLLECDEGSLESQIPAALKLAKTSHGQLSIITNILSARTQEASPSQLSSFHVACLFSNSVLIDSFLDYGAAVNGQVSNESTLYARYTPLHCAVTSKCKENIEVLLKRGADVTIVEAYRMTPLHLALYYDNDDITSIIYKWTVKKITACVDSNGLSYFHVAVAMNNIAVVQKFLDRGDVNFNDRVNENHLNFSGFTPLHFAVRCGHVKMSKLLIKNGANVQTSDKRGYGTPLHMAVSSGNCKLVQLLLENGARIDVLRPWDQKNMLHLLVESYMDAGGKIHKLLEYIKKFVIDFDLDVNAKDSRGYTPLHYACEKISVGAPFAKVLLDLGADIDIESNMHATPFEVSFYDFYRNNPNDYMILFNHVKGLLKLKMNVNPKNNQCCMKVLKERDELQKGANCFRISSLMRKEQERTSEIHRMKNLYLTKEITLYDFLFKKDEDLCQLADNVLLNIIMDGILFEEFSNFRYLMNLQWCRSKKLALKSA